MALSISRAWDESSAILKRDGKAIWTVALALIAMPFTLMTLLAPTATAGMSDPTAPSQPSLLPLLVSIVLIIASLAITAIALRPQSTVGGAIGDGARRILSLIGVYLLVAIPVFFLLMLVAALVIGADADPAAINATVASGNLPSSFVTFALICVVAALLIGVKLMMVVPVTVAETGNPLKILTRSWSLSNGNFLKLLGFTALFVIAASVVLFAVVFIFGSIVIAVFGSPEAMSMGALFTGLVMGLAYAAIMAVYAVMVARIYNQLAHRDVGVPTVERA